MNKNEISDILAKPYARLVIPDVDGTFAAEIVEFPGCVAMGTSAAEAIANLDEVAADWIEAALAQDQDIPEPMSAAGHSGKLVLRMPKSLHQKAALYAERDGVSLNQFIVSGLAEQIGTRAHLRTYAAPTYYAPVLLLQIPHVYPTAPPSKLGQLVASGTDVLRTAINLPRDRDHARHQPVPV